MNAEQDAARAQVVRSHLSVRRRVTDRANYVALPSVAARGVGERREIRRDERKPQAFGSRTRKSGPFAKNPAVGAPKGDALFVCCRRKQCAESETIQIAPSGAPRPSLFSRGNHLNSHKARERIGVRAAKWLFEK